MLAETLQFRWELERVTAELEKTMRRPYRAVRATAREKDLDLPTAAFTLAIGRVGQAALSRAEAARLGGLMKEARLRGVP